VTILNWLLRSLQDGTEFGENALRLLIVMILVSIVDLFLGFALEIVGFLYV
jgi:hypothetical protein